MARSRATISKADVGLAVSLPLYTVLAWALPAGAWPATCRVLASLPGAANPLEPKIAKAWPADWPPADARALVRELEAGRLEHYFQILRDYRPGGWREPIRIEGQDNLKAALDAGNGAILWIDHFVFNGLAPKKGLGEAGYRHSHLSRPEHGFSKTAFGVRWLNPVRARIEDRYLNARVLIERGAETKAVRRLMALLKEGGIVSITAGAWEGRQVERIPMLGLTLPIATGAPSIAISTGAPLVPVTTVKDGGAFRVILDTPIVPPADMPKRDALDHVFAAYRSHLEPWIRAFPGQWRGWKYLA